MFLSEAGGIFSLVMKKKEGMKTTAEKEIGILLENLTDSDWWVRKDTIQKLLDYPAESYVGYLIQWLRNDEDALVRNAAMEMLREMGTGALSSLLSLLQDEDSDIRIFSANVLGDLEEPAALDALGRTLRDPDENVRTAAVEAIGKIGEEKAVDLLIEASSDHALWVAMAAIEAMGKIGGKKAISGLHACLGNKDCRAMVCSVLGIAGEQNSIEYLIPLLDQEDTGGLALQAAVTIADRDKGLLPPSFFSDKIEMLIEWFDSPQDETRRSALIALSWSGDIRGLHCLLSASEDDQLLEYALQGLLLLGGKAAPGIVNAMHLQKKNKRMLAKILAMTGEQERLLFFTGDEDEEVRTEVALAIGSLRTPAASDALLALSRDPVLEVREAALLSIRMSGGDLR
jgi:HEAT repeat protein